MWKSKSVLIVLVIFTFGSIAYSRTGCEFIGSETNKYIKSNNSLQTLCNDYSSSYRNASKSSSTFEENNRKWLEQIKQCKSSNCVSSKFETIIEDFRTKRESFISNTKNTQVKSAVEEEFDYGILLNILYGILLIGSIGGGVFVIIKNPTKASSYWTAFKKTSKQIFKIKSGITAFELVETYIYWVYRVIVVQYMRVLILFYVLFFIGCTTVFTYLASAIHPGLGILVLVSCIVLFSIFSGASFGMFIQVNKLQKRLDEK